LEHIPGDTPCELSKALVQGQKLSKGCEALCDDRSQISHVVHQLALQARRLSQHWKLVTLAKHWMPSEPSQHAQESDDILSNSMNSNPKAKQEAEDGEAGTNNDCLDS